MSSNLRVIVLDMNSALPILSQFHHWALKVENRGSKRLHSCTITHDHKRVVKYAAMPIDAVKKAIYEMRAKMGASDEPTLRLTR